MRKLMVLQHVPYELLGTLHPLIKSAGFRIRYINYSRHPNSEPNLKSYNGLIVLGGGMSVNDVKNHPHLANEVKLIQKAIDQGIPVLGICLGSQLIAKALGATVQANKQKEIGWYTLSLNEQGQQDPILKHMKAQEQIFQWHGDTFALPEDCVHLASSELCANQAFRYGDRVYGFQFHLEVDQPMIENWLTVPENQGVLAELQGQIDPDKIRKQTFANMGRNQELSKKVFGAFLDLFGDFEKRRMVRLHPRR